MTTARTTNKESAPDTSSMDFISQMVATGLSNSFETLKDKVSATIKDNGEEYLSDALEKLKKSASNLAEWSKQNPVKTAVAVAAVLAVTAFLVATAKSNSTGSSTSDKSESNALKSVNSDDGSKRRLKSA